MYRSWLIALIVPVWIAGFSPLPSAAQEGFDVNAEVRDAIEAIENTHASLGGMGGLGVIPEPDLSVIQGMLGEAESLLREARALVQDAPSLQDGAWAVGYARAAKAMALAVNEYRVNQGYQ